MKKFKYGCVLVLIAMLMSACNDKLSVKKEVSLEFIDNAKDIIKLEIYSLSDGSLNFVKAYYQGQEFTLPQVVSADGARYSAGKDITIWLIRDRLNFEQKVDGNTKEVNFFLVRTSVTN